jgi:REP element-mobilizing transposase RayT
MPNHIHGIIVISPEENLKKTSGENKEVRRNHQKVPVVSSFKSAVSKSIHDGGNDSFGWHRSYYDHIIRDENDIVRIREYIQNNPMKWESSYGSGRA